MDKKKKAIFGLLIESGRWCVPPGLVMDWKDPWMITGEGMSPILFEHKEGFLD